MTNWHCLLEKTRDLQVFTQIVCQPAYARTHPRGHYQTSDGYVELVSEKECVPFPIWGLLLVFFWPRVDPLCVPRS